MSAQWIQLKMRKKMSFTSQPKSLRVTWPLFWSPSLPSDLYGSLFLFLFFLLLLLHPSFPPVSRSSLSFSLSLSVDSEEVGTRPHSSARAATAPRKVESRDAAQRLREEEGKAPPVAPMWPLCAPVCFHVDGDIKCAHLFQIKLEMCDRSIKIDTRTTPQSQFKRAPQAFLIQGFLGICLNKKTNDIICRRIFWSTCHRSVGVQSVFGVFS